MAKHYTGREGRLVLGGNTLVKVVSWQMTASLDALEVTTLGDLHRNYIPGLQTFTGTAQVMYYVDDDRTNDASTLLRKLIKTGSVTDADLVAITFRLTDGGLNNDVTLNAYITSAAIGAAVSSIVVADISFQGTGALAAATV